MCFFLFVLKEDYVRIKDNEIDFVINGFSIH